MKMLLQMLVVLSFFVPEVRAQFTNEQVALLRNDKEPMVKVFSKKERLNLLNKYQDKEQVKLLTRLLYLTIQEASGDEKQVCELRIVDDFKAKLAANKLASDQRGMLEYLKVIRSNDGIDDILYLILEASIKDHFNLLNLNVTKNVKLSKTNPALLENNDNLSELFGNFDVWPDDRNNCTYQEFYFIKTNTYDAKGKKTKSNKDVRNIIREAYAQKLISLESYHKMVYLLDDAKLEKRDLWLNLYLKIAITAKNTMTPNKVAYTVKNIEDENDFSQERIKRFSKVTRRRLLYRKYDETQIILLAQVLQKASRRMGADPDTKASRPVITQEFWVDHGEGEQENYVEQIELDPQSQFNLARRRMRKDMTELQMMDVFNRITITHEDIVMAALETGYITLDDISYVVKYDDLWNPEISKFERISGFIFRVAGYSTFFLPPPWNITTSIALGVIEGIVDSKNPNNGASNDNPGTFIE